MTYRVLRLLVLCGLALGLGACTDSKSVSAAFSQTRVSWFRFDAEHPDGLRALAGFEQAEKVVWLPRNRAVFATDLLTAPGGGGAVAVSGLGLLLLDDRDGRLSPTRLGALLPLVAYRTDRLFAWNGKLFLSLYQESPSAHPPLTLAWWSPGQTRLASYPIPSQVKDGTRQAISVTPPIAPSSIVGLSWKQRAGDAWLYSSGSLNLADGSEAESPLESPAPSSPGEEYAAVEQRLAERLGASVVAGQLRGPGTVALFTEAGWVAIAKPGQGRARLYRLPDLGVAGRYTGALALERGFVFTWETRYRGYSGASGLVHVPFGVLAP